MTMPTMAERVADAERVAASAGRSLTMAEREAAANGRSAPFTGAELAAALDRERDARRCRYLANLLNEERELGKLTEKYRYSKNGRGLLSDIERLTASVKRNRQGLKLIDSACQHKAHIYVPSCFWTIYSLLFI